MTPGACVCIIDDDVDLREALRGLFQSVGIRTRAYASGAEFLAAPHDDALACLVLDVRLPGMSGLDLQAHLAALEIHLPIVLMTGHGDIPMTVRAMLAGAVDFLPKPFRDQDMLDAVARAFDRDRDYRARRAEIAGIAKRHATLTPREREVMALVTAGRMNKQIADDLKISEVTVKIHRGAVMKKMAARSLADLVRYGEALDKRSGGNVSH